jgi:hypothetical protein
MDGQERFVLTLTTAEDREGCRMDEEIVELLARQAGLDKALAEFRDDVIAAARQTATLRQKLAAPTDPRVEPWPAMRPGEGL